MAIEREQIRKARERERERESKRDGEAYEHVRQSAKNSQCTQEERNICSKLQGN